MAWIESHQTLARHPKTRKLARLLGVGIPQAIGHLHLLWWWAMDYAQDGSLGDYDNADLADAAMWEGDAQVLVDALLTCGSPGFLELRDGVHHIHDWEEYAGKLIDQRQANAQRMREARAKRSAERAAHVQDTFTTRETLPNRTQPNSTEQEITSRAYAREGSTQSKKNGGTQSGKHKPSFYEVMGEIAREAADLDEGDNIRRLPPRG